MDNSEISWTIRKFHGRYETPPSIDGQLSVDNRCAWTIVHETYKTQRITANSFILGIALSISENI
jgi:hypothetical protein